MNIKTRLILFIIILFLFNITAVRAETPTPTPEYDCGHMNQICCTNEIDKNREVSNPELENLPGVLRAINSIAKSLSSSLTKSMLSKTQNALDDTKLNLHCYEGEEKTIKSVCICDDTRVQELTRLCTNITIKSELSGCLNCVDPKTGKGIWTGLGCLNYDIPLLIKNIFSLGLGLAGMTALLCIIYSAFMMQTSQGNPEKIKKAQQLLISCITGLMLIIFSIFILKLVGVSILKIPGFI